jgi:hypothetical protein
VAKERPSPPDFCAIYLAEKLGAKVGEKMMRRTVKKRRKSKARCSLLLAAFHLIFCALLVD